MKNYHDDDFEQDYRSNYRFGEVNDDYDDDFAADLTHKKRRKGKSRLPLIIFGSILGIALGVSVGFLMRSVGYSGAFHFGSGSIPDEPDPGFGFDFGGDVETHENTDKEYSLPPYIGDNSGLTIPLNRPGATESVSVVEPVDLYQQQLPSTVSITVYAGKSAAYGSGMILTPDGYILTCEHVIDDSEECTVTLWDDRKFSAQLVGSDEQTDLAVLKIDAEDLHPVTFVDSDALQIGEAVYAIGDSLGPTFRSSFTNGIISGLNRSVTSDGNAMSLVQTTAPINSGNSGGALFNRFGQVIGVTNMKMSNRTLNSASIDNMGLTIPSRTIQRIVEALAADGSVTHPVLGITCYTMDEVAAHVNDIPEGLWIVTINEHSDCKKQGLLVGDLITEADGQPVTSVPQFQSFIRDKKPGDTVTLTIWRDEVLADKARADERKAESQNGDSSFIEDDDTPAISDDYVYQFEYLGDFDIALMDAQDVK